MPTILISGGNRGIGLELCRQYRQQDATVYATSRRPAAALEELGVNVIEGIDLARYQQISGRELDPEQLAEAIPGADR